MGNAIDPTSILEQIKRARLYNPNFGQNLAPVQDQGVSQASQQAQASTQDQNPPQLPTQAPNPGMIPGSGMTGTIQPPAQSQPSPRDQALSEYRQMIQSGAPSQSDYKPSITRRIIGALLGAGVGLSNPQAGSAIGHQISYGPYDKASSDYQKKLAEKKLAYETESGAQKEGISEKEQLARTDAEGERAQAETARRLGEEGKLRSLQPGTPEFEGEERKLKIQHPNTPKIPVPYELTLKNDEKVVGYEGQNGQFKDAEGNIYGTDSIKSARKVGTSEPKSSIEKPAREGEAGAIDQWTKEHGREPSYAERKTIHREYADAPKDTGVNDFRKEIQMQTAREVAQRPHQRNLDAATNQLDRINRSISMIDTSKPEDIALAIPEILTSVVSGQGTGVRITTPEINRMVHARGLGESVDAFLNKLKGKGDLGGIQKSDLKGLLTDVQAKVVEKQKDISDLMDKIDSATKPEDIGKAQIEYRKKLTGSGTESKNSELPGGITLDDINKELERRKKGHSGN